MNRTKKLAAAVLLVVAAGVAAAGCGASSSPAADTGATTPAQGTLLKSAIAVDDAAGTATLPAFRGTGPDGRPVWYIVTESSDRADAEARGVTYAPKLANALGTKAVQRVTRDGDSFDFAGTVDFSPERSVTPGPEGFPPKAVAPGAVGDAKYSPLISPDGAVVLNATQIRNASGTHDAVVSLDEPGGRVTLKTLHGFFNGATVSYLRLDASADVVAALEESIYAPNLGAAPGAGSNDASSSRSAIVPIVNGARGKDNPRRQGLQSAVLGEGEPLNVTESLPGAADYSPIWDVTPAMWSADAISGGRRVLVTGNRQIADAVAAGDLRSVGTGPAHPELGGLMALGAVSNCPTLSIARAE